VIYKTIRHTCPLVLVLVLVLVGWCHSVLVCQVYVYKGTSDEKKL
jgi:hypothetical protein